MVNETQRQKTAQFRFFREQADEQARQSDRFLAQGLADECLPMGRRVAFVEDQIDGVGNDGEACRARRSVRLFVSKSGSAEAFLRAGDPLFHRFWLNEKGTCNLIHRQSGNNLEGKRDLLVSPQHRMAAGEQKPQHVVPVGGAIELVRKRLFRVRSFMHGFQVFRRGQGFVALLPKGIDSGIASGNDQPRRRVLRDVVVLPGF